MLRPMGSPARFLKIVIGDAVHYMMRNPRGRELQVVIDRLRVIYPGRTVDVDSATRAEWGRWHGLTVIPGYKAE